MTRTPLSSLGQLLPDTDDSRRARSLAFEEIEKLDELLVRHGHPRTGFLEKPMLVTYIMAKRLGLLEQDADGG
jgi:hypothetical protein